VQSSRLAALRVPAARSAALAQCLPGAGPDGCWGGWRPQDVLNDSWFSASGQIYRIFAFLRFCLETDPDSCSVYNVGFAIQDDNITTRGHQVFFVKTLGIGAKADTEAVKLP